MRTPAGVARGLLGLAGVCRAAGRAHGRRPSRLVGLARQMRRRGFEYEEMLRLGALDPAMAQSERDALVSRHVLLEATAPLNGGNVVTPITGDKLVFQRLGAAIGLPLPGLEAVLPAAGAGVSASGRMIATAADLADVLAHSSRRDIVVKPADGYAGRGVRVLRRGDDGLLREGGRAVDLEGLWNELRADEEFAAWLIQERLVNHPALPQVGAGALHGVRIATLTRRDGSVVPLFAMLKIALAGGVSDNFLGGSTGNGIAEIGLGDGVLGPLRIARPGGAGLAVLSHVPAGGEAVEGRTLPDWAEALSIVLGAAPAFLPYRALGWDVALTPDGPVVLEVNIRWLPMPFPSMPGVLARLRAEA